MIKVQHAVTINKPVEQVYAYVNDEGNTTKWQNGVIAVEYPDGTPQVGTQFKEVRKFMGRDMGSTMEITALELNKKYAAKTLSGPVPYEVTVVFDSVPGGTQMTTTVIGEPKGFFKLAEGAVSNQLKKSLEEDGRKLKELVEAL